MPKKAEGRYNVRVNFEGDELGRLREVMDHYGMTVGTELILMLLKREYDQLHNTKPRFEHVNPKEGYPTDHVSILDRELGNGGRIVSVYFKRDRAPFCDYDQGSECVHVDYAWQIPTVAERLRKEGFKSPGEKQQRR